MNTIEEIKSDHARLGERIAALEAQSQQQIIEIPARQIVLRKDEEWGGTLFGLNGEPAYEIILLPGDSDPALWDKQMQWAESIGGELPDRREARLLWVNLPHLFQEVGYWLREPQLASNPLGAWMQHFERGHQYWYHEYSQFRARAIRRVIHSVI